MLRNELAELRDGTATTHSAPPSTTRLSRRGNPHIRRGPDCAEDVCSVCGELLSGLGEAEQLAGLMCNGVLSCVHFLCHKCAIRWGQSSMTNGFVPSCPVCRSRYDSVCRWGLGSAVLGTTRIQSIVPKRLRRQGIHNGRSINGAIPAPPQSPEDLVVDVEDLYEQHERFHAELRRSRDLAVAVDVTVDVDLLSQSSSSQGGQEVS